MVLSSPRFRLYVCTAAMFLVSSRSKGYVRRVFIRQVVTVPLACVLELRTDRNPGLPRLRAFLWVPTEEADVEPAGGQDARSAALAAGGAREGPAGHVACLQRGKQLHVCGGRYSQ